MSTLLMANAELWAVCIGQLRLHIQQDNRDQALALLGELIGVCDRYVANQRQILALRDAARLDPPGRDGMQQ